MIHKKYALLTNFMKIYTPLSIQSLITALTDDISVFLYSSLLFPLYFWHGLHEEVSYCHQIRHSHDNKQLVQVYINCKHISRLTTIQWVIEKWNYTLSLHWAVDTCISKTALRSTETSKIESDVAHHSYMITDNNLHDVIVVINSSEERITPQLYWPKQTAAVQTAAVCVTSPLLIYKLLRSGCGSGCGQAVVWT